MQKKPNLERLIALIKAEDPKDTEAKNKIAEILKARGYAGEEGMQLLKRLCYQIHLSLLAWDSGEINKDQSLDDSIREFIRGQDDE